MSTEPYNIYVTGDLERATQLYEMQLQTYPAAAGVLNDLASTDVMLGRYDKAAKSYREALNLDPDAAPVYFNLAVSYLAMEQSGHVHTVLEEGENRGLRTPSLLLARYWEAFYEGNRKEMQDLLSQAAGVPGARSLLLAEQARTESYFGRFGKSQQVAELATSLMERDGDRESAATNLAEMAVREAEVGDVSEAHRTALRSLRLARSQDVVVLAALVMAQAGDISRATAFADELNQRYPSNTLIQKYWLPTIHARVELRQRVWTKALETLSVAEPFELANPPTLATSTLYPAYVRGEIYMAAGDGEQAAAEFSKLIVHPGMVLDFPLGALARLRCAQAYAQAGDLAKARDSYQEFFGLWKDADSGLPILKQAKREYASLQQTHLKKE